MSDAPATAGGSGPLYPQTPAAKAAAERPVHIPGRDDDVTEETTDVTDTDHPTGDEQAAENRDNDPPA